MSAGFCTVCGAVLRDGACPRGHPQRVARRQPRRRRRAVVVFLLLFLLIAGTAYVGLNWYPRRAAADLMQQSSSEFQDALVAYESTVEALPPAGTDPETVLSEVGEVLDRATGAREVLSRARGGLEAREPTGIPVVSSRPPLDQARRLRDRMLAFYTEALEVVAGLESVAGYLTELAATLPQLENLERAVSEPDEVDQVVASATPITDQLIGDLEVLVPPEELGSLHESLLAIMERIRDDLDEAAASNRPATEPVVKALIEGIRGEVLSFRDTLGDASDLALESGLGDRIAEVERRASRIAAGLAELRDVFGISGLTVPHLQNG